MSVIPDNTFTNQIDVPVAAMEHKGFPALHRLSEVRRQHNVSIRTLARRMKMSDGAIRQQECTFDPPLSVLFQWQAALDVPIAELLVEPGAGLAPNINCRAALLKLMKTVRLMEQRVLDERFGFLVQELVHQLTELMPELENVMAWPAVGSRRTVGEISPIEERALTTGSFDSSWVNGEMD